MIKQYHVSVPVRGWIASATVSRPPPSGERFRPREGVDCIQHTLNTSYVRVKSFRPREGVDCIVAFDELTHFTWDGFRPREGVDCISRSV